MPITIFTALWALVALFSLFGLYFFNKGKNIFSFITNRKYLILLLIASLLGMRQVHLLGLFLMLGTIFWMKLDYTPYLEKLRHISNRY